MEWIISANPKVYDVVRAFSKLDFIDWRQSSKHEIGDIIYIYCSGSLRKIMFKCQVVDINIPWEQIIEDIEFWLNKEEYDKSKKRNYMRLSLLEQVDSDDLSLEKLREHGLKGNIQGPMKLDSKPDLLKYIEKSFRNCASQFVFPNEIQESPAIMEGHKKAVYVNRYERNPVARKKCIEHYGCYCQVCDFDFEKVYGNLGEGFIHVHHKTPLSEIGDEYEVDPIRDLIPVCPNCHAMLHRRREDGSLITPEELKALIGQRDRFLVPPIF